MTDPTTTRLATPPGSVLVVRVTPDLGEDGFEVATELHRQTGLPVLVVTDPAEVSVTTPEEAERALAEELYEEPEPDAFQLLAARRRLTRLRAEGWHLVQLSQP